MGELDHFRAVVRRVLTVMEAANGSIGRTRLRRPGVRSMSRGLHDREGVNDWVAFRRSSGNPERIKQCSIVLD